MVSTLHVLAERALALQSAGLPDRTREAVVDVVLDCVTAALAGASSPAAKAMRAFVRATYAPGRSSIWFAGGATLRADGALLANCTAASILDLDDGHRPAAGHPGAAIIPSCFAFAEETDASFDALAAAIVAGYDIATRIGAGRDLAKLDTLSTGRWSNYGVAAAAGLLRGFTHEQIVQAMAIAGVHGPNMSASRYSAIMGNHTKEGIPWSSATAAMAATLAQDGFTGPIDILDHPDYFDAAAILRDEDAPHAVTRVYFKPYSCCRWAHAALDALLALMEERGLVADEIAAIDVATFQRALTLNNAADPRTLEGAQYSVPFVLGVAATRGRRALLPMKADSLHDPASVAVARRVHLSVDPALDAQFPATTAARLDLSLKSGEKLSREVIFPFGDPGNPMSRADLWTKFDEALQGRDTTRIRVALEAFEQGSWRELAAALAQAPA